MRDVQQLVSKHGSIPMPCPTPRLPPLPLDGQVGLEVPEISEFYEEESTSSGFPGGERQALERLSAICSHTDFVCGFEKPKTASTGMPHNPWEPSTTGLSPYLKFGCLSVRKAWHEFAKCYAGRRHSQPPQSLHGQLLFREMFYVLGVAVPNFDKDAGNRMCKPIPWGQDPVLLTAWSQGKTGYPFIDALMRQLHKTGFMHHLGRHAVACFLTRGDLWQSWTAGRDVFDKLLLDADWAVNNGNWLWLAGVAPFSAPYFRIYDPCPGPKSSLNADQTGEFVRHYVPELKDMPTRYIYKPWEAPLAVQRQAGCIVGVDYPKPIVDHKAAREANLQRFKLALDNLGGQSRPLPEKFRSSQDPGAMVGRFREGTLPSTGNAAAARRQEPDSRNSGKLVAGPQGIAESSASLGPSKLRRWMKATNPATSIPEQLPGS